MNRLDFKICWQLQELQALCLLYSQPSTLTEKHWQTEDYLWTWTSQLLCPDVWKLWNLILILQLTLSSRILTSLKKVIILTQPLFQSLGELIKRENLQTMLRISNMHWRLFLMWIFDMWSDLKINLQGCSQFCLKTMMSWFRREKTMLLKRWAWRQPMVS